MLIIATVILVVLFRFACVAGSSPPRRLFRDLIGGLWLGLAGWTAGALLQTAVPIWTMLLVGVALTLAAAAFPRQQRVYARSAADFLTIALAGAFSVIPVAPVPVIAGALAFAVGGFILDWTSKKWLSPRLHAPLLAMPVVLVMSLGLQVRQPGNFGSRLLEEDALFPLRVALVIPSAGQRLPLDQGTAAWLRETPADDPRGTAIVLHGNHRLGSEQPSGLVLQGALLRAGYDVLSVDHPGFGASATPSVSAGWRAWDPTLGALEALRYLRDRNLTDLSETIVVGHSMGVDVALKLVADGGLPVGSVYLWGGSLDRPNGPNWLKGFHRERNLPCCVPEPAMERIREGFYGGGDRFAAVLPRDHAPVHFVRFGIEHADVTRAREPLYASIPEPKQLCDFENVSHYFNTLSVRGFVLIDTLTLQRTAEIFSAEKPAEQACGR